MPNLLWQTPGSEIRVRVELASGKACYFARLNATEGKQRTYVAECFLLSCYIAVQPYKALLSEFHSQRHKVMNARTAGPAAQQALE